MNFDFSDPILAIDVTRLDKNCMDLGIPTSLLMECAGMSAANLLKSKYGLNNDSIVVIFCGTGNNGGDGFVIARHLASQQVNVKIILIGHPESIHSEEARLGWMLLYKLPLFIEIRICSDSTQIKDIGKIWINPNVVIDCLLGTGIDGKIKQPIASAIDLINHYSCPIVSIDVPSGMNPDTGIILDRSVKCSDLFTFHRSKSGLMSIPQQTVLPIGIPSEAYLFVGEGDLQQDLRKRKKDNFKGQYGRMLVIGGSSQYSGAPAL
jgi:hydroxyethylthiazole kinase-like uncharacterized protein yjeF